MALTAAQLVTLACQDANCPGFTSQAGQLLNAVLQELCQTYNLPVAKGFFQFTFNPGLVPTDDPNVVAGSGPYSLPSDYLRANYGDVFWTLQGVPYPMISVELYEFDMSVQQAGNQSYPCIYATDLSKSPPTMYVWPAPSGSYTVTVRYYRQMPDITTPETSSTVPWFPNSSYLRTRLAGELMKITDDDRAPMFLGDSDAGAQGILRRYLNLQNDDDTRAKTVKLDRRRFGSSFSNLPNTKVVGW